jgi:hypothetical protein
LNYKTKIQKSKQINKDQTKTTVLVLPLPPPPTHPLEQNENSVTAEWYLRIVRNLLTLKYNAWDWQDRAPSHSARTVIA